jgi:uncharacterized repeat protein (TIGR03803 family)
MTFRKPVFSFLLTIALLAAASIASQAQVFDTLVYFVGSDGANPQASLVQGLDGDFYGTATYGGNIGCGEYGCGTIFKVDSSGDLTTLHSFSGTDGFEPNSTLTLSNDGNFYGTTYGASGTFFKMTPDGTLTTLYTFCSLPKCADGANPYSGVILATDGNFYGTTQLGGANGYGTVFKITSAGILTTLHSFCANTGCHDGGYPAGQLLEATSGILYGTTPYGGKGYGTVFQVTSTGGFASLHDFAFYTSTNGAYPYSGLIQAVDGNFYGTTTQGGGASSAYYGTVYEMTPSGSVTVTYSFCAGCGKYEGAYPFAGVIQANDGNLYGTAEGYETPSTVFQLTTAGVVKEIKQFDTSDGAYPEGALVQSTDGSFYGTTAFGGATTGACEGSCGTLFRFTYGLPAFLRSVPIAGAVGTPVIILGNSLSTATSVSFNGTPATFTIVSDTEITTSVPTGATTGKIKVTGSTGALSTSVVFNVRQ